MCSATETGKLSVVFPTAFVKRNSLFKTDDWTMQNQVGMANTRPVFDMIKNASTCVILNHTYGAMCSINK